MKVKLDGMFDLDAAEERSIARMKEKSNKIRNWHKHFLIFPRYFKGYWYWLSVYRREVMLTKSPGDFWKFEMQYSDTGDEK